MFTQVFGTQCTDPPSVRPRSRFVMGLVKLVFLLGVGCFGTLVQADLVYVTGHDKISVIDTITNSVVKTIDKSGGMAISPDAKYIYVENWDVWTGVGTVRVLNANTYDLIDTIPVGEIPNHIALNPSGTRAYVPSRREDNVNVVDTSTFRVIGIIPVGDWPVVITTNTKPEIRDSVV